MKHKARRGNQTIETWLEWWGDEQATPLHGLSFPETSTEYRVMMQKAKPNNKNMHKFVKLKPMPRRVQSGINKGNETQRTAIGRETRTTTAKTIDYFPKRTVSKMNICLRELPPIAQRAIHARYVLKYKEAAGAVYCGVKRAAYQNILRDVRVYVAGYFRIKYFG